MYPLFNQFRINFKHYEPPQKEVPANSEVLKALLEYENQEQQGIAGLPEFQENRRSNFNKKLILSVIFLVCSNFDN